LTAVPVLLAEIRAAGAEVALDSGVLRVRVPRGALTAGQRDWLAQHRTEIAALLADPVNDREAPVNDLQAAFDERAAIAAVDSDLGREAADWLARQEVTSGPTGDDVTAWRSWMHRRVPVWQARGLSASEALRTVWSEAESVWHLRHHPAANPNRCAGCGEWMLNGPGMQLIDGAVIHFHFGNPDRLDCLILYGEIWRSAASAALVTLGLRKPE
jgi:hypothetical protein